jgi:hypothetical protein
MSITMKSAPARGEKSGGAERRRSVRTPMVAEAWLSSPTSSAAEDRLDAMTINLSRHGAGFELACPLPEGTFWLLEIGVGEQQIQSEVRVISSRRNDMGLYEIGVEFC